MGGNKRYAIQRARCSFQFILPVSLVMTGIFDKDCSVDTQSMSENPVFNAEHVHNCAATLFKYSF